VLHAASYTPLASPRLPLPTTPRDDEQASVGRPSSPSTVISLLPPLSNCGATPALHCSRVVVDHLHPARGGPVDGLAPSPEEGVKVAEEVWVPIDRWWPTTWWIWSPAVVTELHLQDGLHRQWPWPCCILGWIPPGATLELQDGLCGASQPSVSPVGAGARPPRVVPWPWRLELALLTLSGARVLPVAAGELESYPRPWHRRE
jgi:hypothetical protein